MIQVTMKQYPIRFHVGIHVDFTSTFRSHTPFVGPSSVVWSNEFGPAPPFPPMRVLEVLWSRAHSLVCEMALRSTPNPHTTQIHVFNYCCVGVRHIYLNTKCHTTPIKCKTISVVWATLNRMFRAVISYYFILNNMFTRPVKNCCKVERREFEDTRHVSMYCTENHYLELMPLFNSFSLWNFRESQQCCPGLSACCRSLSVI
jgi:hypothetical protein